MDDRMNVNRRGLLKGVGYVALAFAIPLESSAQSPEAEKVRLPGSLQTNRNISAWIRIGSDKTVTLLIGKVELGQGILTAAAQICADELDVDFGRILLISGDTLQSPNEGTTAGSFSMPQCGPAVRQASAEARKIMLDLAAEKLGKPVDGMTVKDGTITAAGGGSITYWDLSIGKALEREATGQVKPKPASEHRYVGKSVGRIDIPAKMTGGPAFVHEMRPKGMLYGQIVRPPTYKAKLASVDTAQIEKMPGVVKVVRNGSFLAVIAQRDEQSVAAAKALYDAAKWDVEKALPGTDGMQDWLLNAKPARKIETMKKPRVGGENRRGDVLPPLPHARIHRHVLRHRDPNCGWRHQHPHAQPVSV